MPSPRSFVIIMALFILVMYALEEINAFALRYAIAAKEESPSIQTP